MNCNILRLIPGFLKRSQKFEKDLPLVLTLLSKCQNRWEFFPNFEAFSTLSALRTPLVIFSCLRLSRGNNWEFFHPQALGLCQADMLFHVFKLLPLIALHLLPIFCTLLHLFHSTFQVSGSQKISALRIVFITHKKKEIIVFWNVQEHTVCG